MVKLIVFVEQVREFERIRYKKNILILRLQEKSRLLSNKWSYRIKLIQLKKKHIK